jgi:4-aminobutyrate aminotransferase
MSEVNQPPQSEGDVNLSSRRREWQDANIDAKTRGLLERDSAVFLHQSLSTPCLNALQSCAGIFIEDTQGRQYMDFHGNSVHQVGFSHPG